MSTQICPHLRSRLMASLGQRRRGPTDTKSTRESLTEVLLLPVCQS